MDIFTFVVFILILFYVYSIRKTNKEISLYKNKINVLKKELDEQKNRFLKKEQKLLKEIRQYEKKENILKDKLTISMKKIDFFENGNVLSYNDDYKYLFEPIDCSNPIKNAIQKHTGSFGMKFLYMGDIMYVHTDCKGQLNKLKNIGEKLLQDYNKIIKENEITYMTDDVFRNYFKLRSEYEEQINN